jgi:3'-5' exoribonuclease
LGLLFAQTNKERLMNHKFIKELKVGEKIEDFYLVKSKRNKTTRTNKPFLDLDLADSSGQINAKVWDNADSLSELFSRGDVVKIKGTVEEYQNNRQLKINRLRPAVEKDEFDRDELIKSSSADPEEMVSYLAGLVESIQDNDLRALMDAFFKDRMFMKGFAESAGARNIHHAFLGGLLEHTVRVTRVAVFAADELYAEDVDRDLVVAGAILHDIGKIRELSSGAEVSYTTEGYLRGHVVLGSIMLHEKADAIKDFPEQRLLELEHILISHHGEKEWGSPVLPMTPEALIVHLADNLDAKTQIALTTIDEDPNQEEEFTQYHRTLGRHFYKGPQTNAGTESGKDDPKEDD